ncbi:cyclic nucleotide-binding domain-containing protein [Bauldia sp.]|uniref:cyclic nucleotide-binding domain-containing protein n=1 Tax=Bauldia sp. TaxID=2575872 RepID=UPI003BAC0F6B
MDSRGILGSTPFFNRALDSVELDRLADAARPVTFGRGDALMRQRDLGEVMYVLASGTVVVCVHARGGEEVVATLKPGEVVGEMAVITGERRSATVIAKRKVTALEIGKPAIGELLVRAPTLAERFAAVVEQRFAELAARDHGSVGWLGPPEGREQVAARMMAYYSG